MNFQNVFIGILIAAAVIAIAIFAMGGGNGKNSNVVPKIVIWGDVESTNGLSTAISEFNQRNQKKYSVVYTYVKPELFESKLIESIADGKSPDGILTSNTKLLRLENKLLPFSYQTIPMNKFDELYIDASKTFLSGNGILGLPMILDPIVMFTNKDLFTNASIINTPKYWDDVISLEPKLTKRGQLTGTFDYSTIALGEFENITHAKDIIATLMLQAGIPIISRNEKWEPKVSLNTVTRTVGEPPVDSAIRFYMDFSNPLKTLYSWNRSQPSSLDSFLSEKLAIYLGRASDYTIIKEKNPHLNFDIGPVPQMKGAQVEATYAEVYGISILKVSKQQQNALIVAKALADDSLFITEWSNKALLPPARKDLLSKTQTDQVMPYLYNAAIRSKSWLDPREDESNKAFGEMIVGLSSGRFQTPNIASNFLAQELNNILVKLSR